MVDWRACVGYVPVAYIVITLLFRMIKPGCLFFSLEAAGAADLKKTLFGQTVSAAVCLRREKRAMGVDSTLSGN